MAKKVEIWANVIVWGVAALGVYFIIQSRTSPEPLKVSYRRPTWHQIVRNRVQVMLGADRIRLRNVSTSQVDGRHPLTCGEAQPRYRFRAWHGEFEYEDGEYQRFIAGAEVIPMLEKKTDPAEFERMWADMCRR